MRLYFYFARRFFFGLVWLFLVFALLTALLEMIEALRKFDSANVSFVQILRITALRLPASVYEIAPLVVILSSIQVFLSLAKNSELVISRASGRSALQSLASPVAVALCVGIMMVAIVNPIVAATSKQYELDTARILKGANSALSISKEGLWLRQGSDQGQVVVHAKQSNADGTELFDVTFVGFGQDGVPNFRVAGAHAKLVPGAWIVENAKHWQFGNGTNAESTALSTTAFEIATNLTPTQIQDGFGQPSSIPIWELPSFIDRLQKAGFSSRRHEIWFQSELALPALLVTMVLVAASFTMGHSRLSKTGPKVLLALGVGFAIFFIRNFAVVLGENGQIPILLAAWAPPAAGILLTLGLLLHAEDG